MRVNIHKYPAWNYNIQQPIYSQQNRSVAAKV